MSTKYVWITNIKRRVNIFVYLQWSMRDLDPVCWNEKLILIDYDQRMRVMLRVYSQHKKSKFSLRNHKLTEMEPFGFDAATYAKYWMTFLVFSVLPAPDSPVHKIDWSSRSTWGKINL